MSLLDNLTLAYETLADDPIEVGIHYGHSVLEAISAKLVPHIPEPALETAQSFSYNQIPRTREIVARQVVTRKITNSDDSAISRMRRSVAGYSSRTTSNPSRTFSRRPVLGVM